MVIIEHSKSALNFFSVLGTSRDLLISFVTVCVVHPLFDIFLVVSHLYPCILANLMLDYFSTIFSFSFLEMTDICLNAVLCLGTFLVNS